MAIRVLTAVDWEIVRFYRLVADQWTNESPMGEPVLLPRLEGYEAALRIHGYDERLWPVLCSGAMLLHRLIHDQEKIDWRLEIPRLRRVSGHAYAHVRPEDVTDGDP